MPLFERPPLETLAPAKDRWTPLYLEHGRLEVDDSSVKWIGADGLLCRLPVATVSALILGPGTTVTHAAIKACAESNTPVCWTGEESLRFYAFGLAPNHANDMPRLHAEAWADKRRRTHIARAMFKMRFPDGDVDGKWYQKASRIGPYRVARAADRNMGYLWYNGQGVPQDFIQAFNCLSLSAKVDDAVSEYMLGLMYELGQGVTMNRDKAVEWYRKAAVQGDARARSKLINLLLPQRM